MEALTDKQAKVFGFISRYLDEQGMPPTRSDLATAFRITRKAAHDYFHVLARKGYLEILPGSSRGMRILQREDAAANDPYTLPLIGRVAAGPPVLASEEVDDFIRVDPALFKPVAHYLRRVTGSSMIDMGIQDGDLIAVHSQAVADNGQVVVAKLFRGPEPEITVKKLRRRGNQVHLLPRNAEVEPIIVDLNKEEFEIEGLYCGHIHLNSARR